MSNILKRLGSLLCGLLLLLTPLSVAGGSPDPSFWESPPAIAALDDRLNALNRLIPRYLRSDPQKALECSLESLALSQDLLDDRRIAKALLHCALSYKATGAPLQAADYYFRALTQARACGDQILEGSTLNSIGNYYFDYGKFDQAAQYFLQSLDLRETTGDRFGVSKCLNNLGRVFDKLQQYDRAIEYFNQSLALKKQVLDPSGTIYTLNNLGLAHKSNGDLTRAHDCFEEALHLAKLHQSPQELGYTYNNLGEIAITAGDTLTALEHFSQALEFYREPHYIPGETFALLNLSKAFQSQGNLFQSLVYCQQAFALANQIQQNELVKEASLQLSLLYEQTGDPVSALYYLKQHNEIREKLLSENVHEKIVILQLDYEQASKAREIELLKKEAQLHSLELDQRQQIIYTGVAALVMSLAAVYGLRKQVQSKAIRERELLAVKIKLEESNRSLHILAETDSLTGLANRRRFDKTLQWECQSAWENGLDLSLIMIDVDYFKLYNDSYGHHRGDICLQAIARSLRQTLQGDTVLIARYGGEEFAVILLNTSLEKALSQADRARQAIAALELIHEKAPAHGKVTASFGVSSLRGSGNHPLDLIREADHSLYKAKDLGRNQVCA